MSFSVCLWTCVATSPLIRSVCSFSVSPKVCRWPIAYGFTAMCRWKALSLVVNSSRWLRLVHAVAKTSTFPFSFLFPRRY